MSAALPTQHSSPRVSHPHPGPLPPTGEGVDRGRDFLVSREGAGKKHRSAAIPARRSERLFRIFALYLHWYMGRHFHAMRMSRSGLPHPARGRPLIVYSNHPSWWDPAHFIVLCHKLFPDRAGYGPMDAAALGKYGMLERMGVFGVELEDIRGAAKFLRTSLAVMEDPTAMLWITAEGAFTDHRTRPVTLRPGLAHLARRVPGAVILPLAVEYTYWNESRPEALVRFGEPLLSDRQTSVAEWTRRLETGLAETMDALAAESALRNPASFTPLVKGGAGVGGIYDSWRWLRAMAAGRNFDPSHEGET